jgi:hypothetical protein
MAGRDNVWRGDWLVVMGLLYAETVSFEEGMSELAGMTG